MRRPVLLEPVEEHTDEEDERAHVRDSVARCEASPPPEAHREGRVVTEAREQPRSGLGAVIGGAERLVREQRARVEELQAARETLEAENASKAAHILELMGENSEQAARIEQQAARIEQLEREHGDPREGMARDARLSALAGSVAREEERALSCQRDVAALHAAVVALSSAGDLAWARAHAGVAPPNEEDIGSDVLSESSVASGDGEEGDEGGVEGEEALERRLARVRRALQGAEHRRIALATRLSSPHFSADASAARCSPADGEAGSGALGGGQGGAERRGEDGGARSRMWLERRVELLEGALAEARDELESCAGGLCRI
ncbi:hypothetical protein T484DRAFT_1762266 [Baffinella frigidus]|nr:hypothetical protein T484DRAFT_1762266 [Cryptophyta sp. CCMP2293]